MLAVNILGYAKDIYNGTRNYPFPTPLLIGTSGIARVAAIGPDTIALTPGQLVFVDSFVKWRDDPDAAFLLGVHEGFSEGSKKLMHGEWRDATYAEYAKLPLENCFPLNESLLLGKLAYEIEALSEISHLVVPHGGLSGINLKPRETVIISPATGNFGGAAVKVALAVCTFLVACYKLPFSCKTHIQN